MPDFSPFSFFIIFLNRQVCIFLPCQKERSKFKAYDGSSRLSSPSFIISYFYMFSFNLFIYSQGCGFSADCIHPRWLRSVNTILNLPGFRATKDVHVLVCGLVCMHVWNDSCITELMEDMWWGGYGRTPFTSIQSKNMEFGEILTGAHSVINSFPLSQSYSGTHTHAHTRGTDSRLHWFYNDIYCIGSGAQGRRWPAGVDIWSRTVLHAFGSKVC